MRERWDQVKEVLAAALERNGAEQQEYLREACGADDELRGEVESLLRHHAAADSILENSPAPAVCASLSHAMLGRQLGAYRIVGESGAGGMAVVYEAVRADQEFEKRVAIKMLRPGFGSDEVVRRFRQERQTLAALDHPHIVKLLDGGTTAEGWPYLVMEFVEGVPIDEYCRRHRLPLGERLGLFRQVCSAVHYAHQQQVIHRDLKPRNILLAPDGVPRLLDFGIAKLLDPEWPSQGATTGQSRPMTPDYASPEQVRGGPITAATDVYALGVLLYELLTGCRPYRTEIGSWPELERAVCEESPAPPSAVDGEFQRQLRGDLDTIVLTALRKEPHLRYGSAEAFSRDLERYLAGLPIQARRPTVAYRLGKFLGRHRESVAAAGVVLALAAGAAGWEGSRIWQGRRTGAGIAGEPKARPSVAVLGFKNLSGRRESDWISIAVAEMLTTELAGGEALRLVPGETVARSRIDLRLPDTNGLAPDTLQRVRRELGSDFVVSGSYLDAGNGQLRLDLNLQDTARGETVGAVSETGNAASLGELVSRAGARLRGGLGVAGPARESARATAALPGGPEALRLYAEGIARLRTFDALAARDLLARAVALEDAAPLAHLALAKAWQTLGYDAQALAESRRALDLAGGLPREHYLLVEAGYFEASRTWDKAIDTYRTLFRFFPDDLEYGLALARAEVSAGKGKDALATLAAIEGTSERARRDPRVDLGRAEAASSLGDSRLRRDAAESAAKKAAGQGARLLVARARTHECRALANLGENERANEVCEEGRRIYAEAGDRGGLARVLHSAAEVPLNQGDWSKAERLYSKALTLTRDIGDMQGIGRELGNLALIYKYRGDLAGAQNMMEQALEAQSNAGDRNGMAIQTGNIGNVLRMEGKLHEAVRYYRWSMGLAAEAGNQSSASLATSNTGQTLELQGDLAGALKMYQQAAAAQRDLGLQLYYANNLQYQGEVLEQQGDLEAARGKFSEALSVGEKIGDQAGVAGVRVAMAHWSCDSGKPAEAEFLATSALETFRKLKDVEGQMNAGSVLARALREQGHVPAARKYADGAVQLLGKIGYFRVRSTVLLEQAAVMAAEHDLANAERALGPLLDQLKLAGANGLAVGVSLELGRIQMEANRRTEGRATLEETERTARKLGCALIARQAGALLN